MRMIVRTAALLVAVLVLGCSDDGTTVDPDSGQPPDGPSAADQSAIDAQPPDAEKKNTLKVAAIQYLRTDYAKITECAKDPDATCPIQTLVKEAASKGAKLVVTPDYTTYGVKPVALFEPVPAVHDNPATDAKWADTTVLKKMAKLAVAEKITLVFMVATTDGTDKHHTTVAVDSTGKVLAHHDKYMLFGNEALMFEPGSSLDHSFFDSPIGKVGLMSSAEAQCVVKQGVVSNSCTQHASTMYNDYFKNKKPDVVTFVAEWAGGQKPEWQAPAVMEAIAKEGVWLIAANGTETPYGNGGGIWKPDGTPLKTEKPTEPTVIVADIPLKAASPDMGVADAAALDAATADSTSAD
jgi:predicted amidohydrolase